MVSKTFEFIGIKDYCQLAVGPDDLMSRPRTWLPMFAPTRIQLSPPDWELPDSPSAILPDVSTNLGFAADRLVSQEVTVSGSVVANLGTATVKDSSLLVLVRDNLAITEGYGDERWARYQLETWPSEHNYPLCMINTDKQQRSPMRVKVYSLERSVVSVDRPCLYLSVRQDDQNIYHWIFETLSRLKCLEVIPELRKLPLLVREPLTETQLAFLRWMGVDQEIFVTGGRSIEVSVLFFPSIPSPPPIHPDLVSWLRDKIVQGLPTMEGGRRRLFISRRDGKFRRYIVNEEELAGRLRGLGFEHLVMNEMALADQVHAFRLAETIVLPHGAAGTHLLFSPPDCSLIELHSPTQINSVYFALWKTLGRRYGYMIGEDKGGSHNYSIDADKLMHLVMLASRSAHNA